MKVSDLSLGKFVALVVVSVIIAGIVVSVFHNMKQKRMAKAAFSPITTPPPATTTPAATTPATTVAAGA